MAIQKSSAERLLRDKRGSTTVEYAVIAATLIGSLSIFSAYGASLTDRFTWVSQVLNEPATLQLSTCSHVTPSGEPCHPSRP
jgi:Flp pilus assembly pilin Flp